MIDNRVALQRLYGFLLHLAGRIWHAAKNILSSISPTAPKSVVRHFCCFSSTLLKAFYRRLNLNVHFCCSWTWFPRWASWLVMSRLPSVDCLGCSGGSFHVVWFDFCLKSMFLPLDDIQKTPAIFHFEVLFAACYLLAGELRDPWGNEWHQHEPFVIMTQKITG